MDRTTAWRLFHRDDARDEMRRCRRSAVEALEDAAPQMVAAIVNVAEGAPDEQGEPTVDPVARSIAASHGLKALAALKRADAASRVADVEEKRALSPDELAEGRERLMESVRLRLVGRRIAGALVAPQGL
jgi:hypothetical protein